MDIETRQLALHGIDFSCLMAGTGPLMLLLHGFPDTPHSFRGQIEAFASEGWQVVAPYMRGYAPTGPSPDGKYYVAQLGADAIALIEALGHEKAVVVGHDYGAAAAYAAAFTAPQRIEALITESVPHGPDLATAIVTDLDQMRRSWYIFLFQQPFAEMAVQFNDFAFIDRIWRDWSPGFTPPEALLAQVKRCLAQPGALSAVLGYYRTAFLGPPQDSALAAVQAMLYATPLQVPTLYVHGADDGCVGVAFSETMHMYVNARFARTVVPDAGHFVHVEQPGAFNGAVREFIASKR